MELPRYLVTIGTPNGPGVLEVPSLLGPDAAGRRALITAAAIDWGDLPDLTVEQIETTDRCEDCSADDHCGDCACCEEYGWEPTVRRVETVNVAGGVL